MAYEELEYFSVVEDCRGSSAIQMASAVITRPGSMSKVYMKIYVCILVLQNAIEVSVYHSTMIRRLLDGIDNINRENQFVLVQNTTPVDTF